MFVDSYSMIEISVRTVDFVTVTCENTVIPWHVTNFGQFNVLVSKDSTW